jgi:hypothetical protein
MIEVCNLSRITEACPTQWTGDAETGSILIRYRWRLLQARQLDKYGGWASLILERSHGDQYDGHLETSVMKDLIADAFCFCD